MLNYKQLSKELAERIEYDRKNNCSPQLGFPEERVIRRFDRESDRASILRTGLTTGSVTANRKSKRPLSPS